MNDFRMHLEWHSAIPGQRVELRLGDRIFTHTITDKAGRIPDCPGPGWREEPGPQRSRSVAGTIEG